MIQASVQGRLGSVCTLPPGRYLLLHRAGNTGRRWQVSQVAPSRSCSAKLDPWARARRQRPQRRAVCTKATSDTNDPGHWNHSPEWWGTHAGGWGHDAGSTVFMQHSHCGNGEVTVTAHTASLPCGADRLEQQQWRVLRFNDTRQSVSRVAMTSDSSAPVAKADCLAFEYLKTMASAGAAIIGHTGKLDACVATPLAHAEAATHNFFMDHRHSALSSQQRTPCRVLCMGLGGGSLPNFLSHHFPGMLIDAVELDPVVMAAATECMGLPNSRPNMRLHQGDAADYVLKLAVEVQKGHTAPLDIAFIDVFDGNDDVPSTFCNPDSLVLDALATALHPQHGSLIMNLHGGGLPSHTALTALFSGWLPFPVKQNSAGYHHSTEKGQAVHQIASTLRDKLLGNAEPKLPQQNGMAFTLSVAHQSNITVVITRAIKPSSEQKSTSFEDAAERTATAAGFRFDALSRVQRGMTRI